MLPVNKDFGLLRTAVGLSLSVWRTTPGRSDRPTARVRSRLVRKRVPFFVMYFFLPETRSDISFYRNASIDSNHYQT